MDQVRLAYEQLGKTYLDRRLRLRSDRYVRQLLGKLGKNAFILDIGCGAGVPVDDILVKAGHEVVGIDLSEKMIALARQMVPRATYIVGDMQGLSEKEYEVSAVVCLYALFHIPRSEHLKRLKVFASFLPIGGWLLISMGDRAFEGSHEMYGVRSYSSQYGSQANRTMVEQAGFEIVNEKMAVSGGERHQMILARRKH